jgi:hypothetical protein
LNFVNKVEICSFIHSHVCSLNKYWMNIYFISGALPRA